MSEGRGKKGGSLPKQKMPVCGNLPYKNVFLSILYGPDRESKASIWHFFKIRDTIKVKRGIFDTLRCFFHSQLRLSDAPTT